MSTDNSRYDTLGIKRAASLALVSSELGKIDGMKLVSVIRDGNSKYWYLERN